jgi:hypothetical protein
LTFPRLSPPNLEYLENIQIRNTKNQPIALLVFQFSFAARVFGNHRSWKVEQVYV